MDPALILFVICLVYGALFFTHIVFKSCAHYPYTNFLRSAGLDVGLFYVQWCTSALNRSLQHLVQRRCNPRFLVAWFTVGVYFTIFLLPISIILVLLSGFNALTNGAGESTTAGPSLEPIIPGVNLPLDQLGYYVVAMTICSIVHELGHAVAAIAEEVQLLGVGFNVLFILPMAYVSLKLESLNLIPYLKQLRILCAGIWHNIILALLGYLIIVALPMLSSPLFHTENGIIITSLKRSSTVSGDRGLEAYDTILKINNCVVKNIDDYYNCLLETITVKPCLCVTADLVNNYDESITTKYSINGIVECCVDSNGPNACFEYLETSASFTELPQYMCLPIRTVLEHSQGYCSAEHNCKQGLHCVKALIQNTTSLMQIKRTDKDDVIYIGHPYDVYSALKVSNFIPKYSFISSTIPGIVERLCQYVVIFSLGLAVVNVIPCFWFDGQHIVKVLVQVFLAKFVRRNARHSVAFGFTFLGTLFLFVNLLIVIWFKVL